LRRLAALFYVPLLLAGLLWASWGGLPLGYASEEASARGVRLFRDTGAGLFAGVLVVLLSQQITRHSRWGEAMARALGAVLGRLTWTDCLWLAALSGVSEEVFFRGALQPRVGLLAASLLFGLAHLVPRRDLLPWTGFTVAAGLLLGALFEATGNLLAPIVAHAVVNAVNLRFLSERYGAGG
jgi:membrane protease YdiL (CAAX protease family)